MAQNVGGMLAPKFMVTRKLEFDNWMKSDLEIFLLTILGVVCHSYVSLFHITVRSTIFTHKPSCTSSE